MKGDVKRKISSDDWSVLFCLASSPLGLCRPTCMTESGMVFSRHGRVSRGFSGAVASSWGRGWCRPGFYQRLEAYSFFRSCEGA
jgi:hypothetical protein